MRGFDLVNCTSSGLNPCMHGLDLIVDEVNEKRKQLCVYVHVSDAGYSRKKARENEREAKREEKRCRVWSRD